MHAVIDTLTDIVLTDVRRGFDPSIGIFVDTYFPEFP